MGARTRGFANNVLTAGKIDTSDGLSGAISNSNVNNTSVSSVTSLPPSVGSAIASVSSNPSAPESTGIIWYNTTDERFKIAVTAEAWHSGGPLLTARHSLGGTGSQTAALAFGGPSANAATEEYNGFGWGSGGNLNTGRSNITGAGTQTAGLGFGGYTTAPNTQGQALTEEYDGTSWAVGGTLSISRYNPGGFGTQTAAAACGGYNNGQPLGNVVVNTEEYDGSSWTSGGNLGTARYEFGSCGTQTAGLAFMGYDYNHGPAPAPLRTNETEEYDGTSWTRVNSANDARGQVRGSGSQTEALAFGGFLTGPGPTTNKTEKYDGTTWSVSPATLGTARHRHGESKTSGTAALAFGGQTPPTTGVTEEYNLSAIAVTAGAWTSGANYPVTIQDAAGSGPVTASVIYGGYDGPAYVGLTNEYNGTAYSTSNPMGTARACYNTGAGSQTAALQASGYATSEHTNASEEYNGTSWSEGNNLNYERYNATGGGVQTSAIICGGNGDPSNSANAYNESYNGTSWSNETALPGTTAGGKMYSGTGETASLIIGFGSSKNDTLSYDGTSWTDLGHHLVEGKTTTAGGSHQGTTTAALIAGGFSPPGSIVTSSQLYNGTIWVTSPSIATARRGGAAAGTAASCMAVGGERPAQSNHTEEFVEETSALNAENITDS